MVSLARTRLNSIWIDRISRVSISVTLSVALAACDGGSGDSSEPDGSNIVDDDILVLTTGSEPRRRLEVASSTETMLNIAAQSVRTILTENSEDDVDALTANYDLRVSLDVGDESAFMSIIPLLNEYSIPEVDITGEIPGSWKRTYSLSGQLIDVKSSDTDGFFAFNTLQLFSVPGMVLAVPRVDVGVGAKWQYTLSRTSGDVVTLVTINALDDDRIQVSIQSALPPDVETTSTGFSNTVNAAYDTSTLLIESGNSEYAVNTEYTLSRNGTPTLFKMVFGVEHAFSSVMP